MLICWSVNLLKLDCLYHSSLVHLFIALIFLKMNLNSSIHWLQIHLENHMNRATMINTCSVGLAASSTFNFANDKRISSNFVLACSKSKSLSNLIVVFGRPLLFWLFMFCRNDCYWKRGYFQLDLIVYLLIGIEFEKKSEKFYIINENCSISINLPDEDLDVFVAVGYYCERFDCYCVPNYRHGSGSGCCCLDIDCCAVDSNESKKLSYWIIRRRKQIKNGIVLKTYSVLMWSLAIHAATLLTTVIVASVAILLINLNSHFGSWAFARI